MLSESGADAGLRHCQMGASDFDGALFALQEAHKVGLRPDCVPREKAEPGFGLFVLCGVSFLVAFLTREYDARRRVPRLLCERARKRVSARACESEREGESVRDRQTASQIDRQPTVR